MFCYCALSFTGSQAATFAGNVLAPSLASTDGTGRYYMIQNASGNVTYPVYSFKTDGNTGMMNPSDDTLSLVTGGATRLTINNGGQVKFNNYTAANSFTGTAVASLAVDSSGNIITEAAGGGGTITKQLFAVGATATTAFPLTSGINPENINYVNIFIDGVYQNSGSYTVSTTGTTTTVTLSASVSNVSVEIVSTT